MDLTSDIIGEYRLLKPLGHGGMGVVYQAEHVVNGDSVALKTIRTTREFEIDSIRREIRALARMDHPSVVRILDSGLHDGMPWYAMELLTGSTLREYLLFGPDWVKGTTEQRDDGTSQDLVETFSDLVRSTSWAGPTREIGDTDSFPCEAETAPNMDFEAGQDRALPGRQVSEIKLRLREILTIVRWICSPLAYIHGEGLVHRDLKPENIFITTDGMPVLVDFGLTAQFSGAGGRDTLHVERGGVGTVNYIAPEQIRGEPVDARADLYALGCILYELLCGHPPFTHRSIAQLLEDHLNRDPLPPSALRVDIFSDLDQLVLKLLAKDPRDRFGYADSIAMELAKMTGDDGYLLPMPSNRTYLYRSRFVGRKSLLSRLNYYTDKLQTDTGGLILIGGETGAGKTRCAMEFGRELAANDAEVLTGEAFEHPGRPLEALLKPLQRIADRCRVRGSTETDRLLGYRGLILAEYEPACAGLPGLEKYPQPVGLPPDAARTRLFSYLMETFSVLAQDKGLALILDDLQWADDLVIGFIEYALRGKHLEKNPLLVLGTYRTDTITPGLQKIIDAEGAHNTDLNRLDEQAISTIIGDMLALFPPPTLISQYLGRICEGNPFFIAEYLRLAVEEGLLRRDERGTWQVEKEVDLLDQRYETLPLSDSLQKLIERRLNGLTLPARDLINAAAVVGQETSVPLLMEMIQLDEENLFDSSTELLTRQLLEKPDFNSFRFVHAQIQAVTLALLDTHKKSTLHRAAARGIEALFAHNRAQYLADLGYHWQEAGDRTRARTYYLQAARNAKDRYAYGEAVRLFQAYLHLIKTPIPDSIEAQLELGSVITIEGRWEEALDIYRQAQMNAQTTKDERLMASAMLHIGLIFEKQGNYTQALDTFSEALLAFKQIDDKPGQSDAVRNIGAIYDYQGFLDKALTHFERSLSIVEPSADKFRIGRAIGNMGIVHMDKADYEKALDCFQQWLAIAESMNDQLTTIQVVGNMGGIFFNQGDFDRARDCCLRAISIAEKLGDHRNIGFNYGNLCIIYLNQDNYEQARECSQHQLTIAEALGDQRGVAIALTNSGNVQHARGVYDQALEFYQRTLAVAELMGDQGNIGATLGRMGKVYSAQGNFSQAFEHYQRSLAITDSIGESKLSLQTYTRMGELCNEHGEYDQALTHFEDALSRARTIGEKILTHTALVGIAGVLYEKHQLSAAQPFAAEALQVALDLKMKKHIVKAQLLVHKIEYTLGKENALNALQSLLHETDEVQLLAEIHYELWCLTALPVHGQTSLQFYQNLYTQNPKYDYKQKIKKLSE